MVLSGRITTKSGTIKIAPAADEEHILIQLDIDDNGSPALEWCQTRLALTPVEAERVIGALKEAVELIKVQKGAEMYASKMERWPRGCTKTI